METDLQKETPAETEEIDELAPMRDEIESLVELIKDKVNSDNLTPCPGCNIMVEISVNRCPHCDSNIAANNALVRESLRRLGEIRGELDGQHEVHVESLRDPSEKRSFGERFKQFFSGSPREEELDEPAPKTGLKEPRIFDTIAVGDPIKVLEAADPWFKVKTREGKTGWVYSTILKDE